MFVAIDTYEDNQRAYEFVANPYGIQGDLMRTGSNEDASWDAVWYSKGTVNDTGYVVEMAIPFKSIHFPSNKSQDWSVMIIRNLPESQPAAILLDSIRQKQSVYHLSGGDVAGITGPRSDRHDGGPSIRHGISSREPGRCGRPGVASLTTEK